MREFVQRLASKQELLVISEFVDPKLEIAEITDRISKQPGGAKAILFENTGTDFPVLTNALGSEARISMALGVENLAQLKKKVSLVLQELTQPKHSFMQKMSALGTLSNLSSIFPVVTKGAAPSQEVVHKMPNLGILPVLKCWPLDGGRFITLPLVHTVSPITGLRNLGMYRMQIFDKNTTGMHWHKHKVGARHFSEYKSLGRPMPVAVALGGDPVYSYAATAPMPENVDEYILAGFLRGKKVKLTKCITQDIEVPVDADIVIEGYVDTSEDFWYEGPFGDHTGFYSLADYYPAFHVTCITHKADAIYPATIVGVPPQEDAYIAKATEHIFLPPIQQSVAPEIIDMHLPEAGVAHNFTILKVKTFYEEQAVKIMNAMWGAGQMALNKFLFITNDKDIDITDYKSFIQKVLIDFDPTTDLYHSSGPVDVLDHASEKFTFGSKLGFDFTRHSDTAHKSPPEYTEHIDIEKLKEENETITAITSLLSDDIPIMILAVKKESRVVEMVKKLIEKYNFSAYKILICVDSGTDINDLYHTAWICGNNIAPGRDTEVLSSRKYNNNLLFADATKKTKEIDGFEREWPEYVVMSQDIIKKIDKEWHKYGIGEMITSPSKKFYD